MSAEHWAHLEFGADAAVSRSVCSCGWHSEQMPPEDAAEAGLVHTGRAAADADDSQTPTPKVLQAFRAMDAIQEDIKRIEVGGLRLIDPATDPLHVAARRVLAAFQVLLDGGGLDQLRDAVTDLEAALDPVTMADLDALRSEPDE